MVLEIIADGKPFVRWQRTGQSSGYDTWKQTGRSGWIGDAASAELARALDFIAADVERHS